MKLLGFELTKEKLDDVYEEFVKLADKKKDIRDDDIALLVGDATRQERRIKLDFLQVVTGKNLKPMASVRLDISGEKFDATASVMARLMQQLKRLNKSFTDRLPSKSFLFRQLHAAAMMLEKCTCKLNTTKPFSMVLVQIPILLQHRLKHF